MAGALDADPEAVVAGEADGAGDVGRVVGDRDGGRMLVDGQVPGEACLVPAGVPGSMEIAGEVALAGCSGRRCWRLVVVGFIVGLLGFGIEIGDSILLEKAPFASGTPLDPYP